MDDNNVYYKSDNFIILGVDCCDKSERTKDINVFDLANDEKILNSLKLHYLSTEMSHEARGIKFAFYLGSFTKGNEMEKILVKNPVLRILYLNK